jgi:hypothetical protein
MRRKSLILILALAALLVAWGPVSAKMFEVGGKPASVQGYISQSIGHSLEEGDYYDIENDFNQALMNLFVEGDVKLSGDLSFYAAGMLTVDWIYDLQHNDVSWKAKRFNESRDALYIDDEWWQLVKEAHLTWSPGDFTFRIGKQVVRWGELFALAVNDVIMPNDYTHGLAEVELETLYIPIPLINVSYGTFLDSGPFQTLDIQFIFNPNADFIPSPYGADGNVYGNDRAGIWAADVVAGGERLGRLDISIDDDPDSFDSDYFEYGVKISTITQRGIFSLMGFYGINNSPALGYDLTNVVPFYSDDTFLPDFSDYAVYDTDGNPVANYAMKGQYVDEKFVGASWSTELPFSSALLGNVKPMLDVEVSYRFDDAFLVMDWATFTLSQLETDKLVAGVGIVWKMKVPWQKGYISLIANAAYNQYDDKDVVRMVNAEQVVAIEESSWDYFFDISTTYKKWDINPGVWVYAISDWDMSQIAPYIIWTPNSRWSCALTGTFFEGRKHSAWGVGNKDSISLKATRLF